MNHTYWKKAPLVCLISEEDTINDNKVQNLKKIYMQRSFFIGYSLLFDKEQ